MAGSAKRAVLLRKPQPLLFFAVALALALPVTVPWGGKPIVTNLVEIFHDHEKEHIQDILSWQENPDKPLSKGGY